MNWRRSFILLFVGTAVCLGGLQIFIQIKAKDLQFKKFTESKLSEFLQARVEIQGIKAGLFSRIALKGLDIFPEENENLPYEVKIQEIEFQYNWWQLLKRQFESPATIVLDAPEISLQEQIFPYAMLERLNFSGTSGFATTLKLQDGYIRLHLPSFESSLELKNLTGIVRPTDKGLMRVDFKAQLDGIISGKVRIRGVVDTIHRTHNLTLDLEDVNLGQKLPIPLNDLFGRIRWENDSFNFQGLNAKMHGWNLNFGGELQSFLTKPILSLIWELGKREKIANGSLKLDLAKGVISVNTERRGQALFDLNGSVEQSGYLYTFTDLTLNKIFTGEGSMNFSSGDYYFEWNRENERVSLTSNLRGLDMRWKFVMNHIKWFNLDLATSISVHLIPLEKTIGTKFWRFQGTFSTDYFILEYLPLDDFQGSFEMTPFGLRNLVASWGKVFNLSGAVDVKGNQVKPHLQLKVDGFDLKDVRQFANKPLPKQLGGLLEGRLKIVGDAVKPEIIGLFTVKDGTLGRLDYDRGIIQFRGIPPYLEIADSYVTKGRMQLQLEGAINLSLDNIFHGIEIRTPDKLAIWRGLEINTSQEERDLEIGSHLLPKIALSVGSQSDTASVTASGAKKEEDAYLVVGPKFKF